MEKNVYLAEYGVGVHSSDGDPGGEAQEVDVYGTSEEVVVTMTSRLKECASQFGRLEAAVDR